MTLVVNQIKKYVKILSVTGGIFFSLACANDTSGKEQKVVGADKLAQEPANYYDVTGYAQGTTYKITYQDSLGRNLSMLLDSVIHVYDAQNSTYVPESIISRVNQAKAGDTINLRQVSPSGETSWFVECFKIAKEVYQESDGAFNPTVLPLVKAWGFMDAEHLDAGISKDTINKLLKKVDFSDGAIHLIGDSLIVKLKDVQIDFNAIAQGHSVDVVVDFLKTLGVVNTLVEIGGELACVGVNYNGTGWRVGIDKPVDNAVPGQEFEAIVQLSDKALATSGNYRKFYVKDGVKYAHTLNPKTGYPVQHSLLSATVITDNCAKADAYATAFMVLGVDKGKELVAKHPELDVMLVFDSDSSDYSVWSSSKFYNYIK